MQTIRRNVLALSIIILAVLVFPGTALAQADGFQETFDNPALPGWERHPEATVSGGVLSLQPGSFALHFGDWSDIDLSLKVRLSGEGECDIAYYFLDRSSYHLVLSGGKLDLQKEQQGERTSLGSAEVPALVTGEWLEIEITVSAGQHTVYVNNEEQLSLADSEPLPAGAILLSAHGGLQAEFDDLDLRGTPGTGQPVQAQNPSQQPESVVAL